MSHNKSRSTFKCNLRMRSVGILFFTLSVSNSSFSKFPNFLQMEFPAIMTNLANTCYLAATIFHFLCFIFHQVLLIAFPHLAEEFARGGFQQQFSTALLSLYWIQFFMF